MKKEKSSKTLVIAFSLFIVFSMVLSIFAIILDNPGSSMKYGKYKFSIINNAYVTKIGGIKYDFSYFPTELESIAFPAEAKKALNDSLAFVILFDPNSTTDDLTFIDYARFDLSTKSPKQVYFGITKESEKYPMPVVSCENATKELPIFYINISNNLSITNTDNQNCFMMNARLKEIVTAENRLLYQLVGVMQ